MVQRIFEVSSIDNNNIAAIFRDCRDFFNSSYDVELVIYVKNLMLTLLTERNKVSYGNLSVRPALYFHTTRDKKSFFVAQPIFLSINTIEEVL